MRNNKITATATLKQLARRNLLINAINLLKSETNITQSLLRKLVASKTGIPITELQDSQVSALCKYHLAQPYDEKISPAGLPFGFVVGLNFELTYGCNLACSHCLQDGLRPSGKIQWTPLNVVIRTLKEAKWLGLTTKGVNFTGGENFLPHSPILDILDAVKKINIPVRANTNASWGGQKNITIGNQYFANDEQVVKALKEKNLGILALSLDDRYRQYPDLLDRFVRVIYLCEINHQFYEIVSTSPSKETIAIVLGKLATILRQQTRYMNLSAMETVDIGAAALNYAPIPDQKEWHHLTLTSPCQGNGFHRPFFLHIAPNGGVRSCMYAPNSGWYGNINQQTLPEILNKASENPVHQLFQSTDFEQFTANYITPWLSVYQQINHGCTASALIARVVEEVEKLRNQHGTNPSNDEMAQIHHKLAREYRLES
jgi:MoaA/NifB/PqqE/SkfB family radical SAM enzyme